MTASPDPTDPDNCPPHGIDRPAPYADAGPSNCPTCGHHVTDDDPTGCEAPTGQRYCLVHVPYAELRADAADMAEVAAHLHTWCDQLPGTVRHGTPPERKAMADRAELTRRQALTDIVDADPDGLRR